METPNPLRRAPLPTPRRHPARRARRVAAVASTGAFVLLTASLQLTQLSSPSAATSNVVTVDNGISDSSSETDDDVTTEDTVSWAATVATRDSAENDAASTTTTTTPATPAAATTDTSSHAS